MGNEDCTLLLSGGQGDAAERASAVSAAGAAGEARLLVECGGSSVSPPEQLKMVEAVSGLVADGNKAIKGVVLSSYLLHGSQRKGEPHVQGMSVTEPCIDWMETQSAVRALASAVRKAKGNAKRQKH